MSIVNCSDLIRRSFHFTGTEHLLWDDAASADRTHLRGHEPSPWSSAGDGVAGAMPGR